jgi:hypothetical protein
MHVLARTESAPTLRRCCGTASHRSCANRGEQYALNRVTAESCKRSQEIQIEPISNLPEHEPLGRIAFKSFPGEVMPWRKAAHPGHISDLGIEEFACETTVGCQSGVPSSSSLAFQDGAPIYTPVAKARIPAAPVACERICGSR